MVESLRRKILKYKTDILNLEWETDSRDTNITDPILVSLEDRFGYNVKTDSIWYAFYKILKYRPKVLLMSNEVGAIENYYICRFAYSIGIKTIVLISEGLNYQCETEDAQKQLETEMLWGHNTDHKRIWDMKLLWSESTRETFYKYIDSAKDLNLKVSGATGFDSYKLLNMNNTRIIEQFNKSKYKKVILLVGFAFDLYPLYDLETLHMDKETVDWLYNQRFKVRDIYKQLIEENPDTLFILKHHPGSKNLDDTEFSEIMNKYDNTITIHKEVGIRNLLGLSEIIIAYDSTVCLEAWMLRKPSLLINPEEGTFPRSWNYLGSPILRTATELSNCIREFYENGIIQPFEDLKQTRIDMIRKQIQNDDGFNYLRAAKLIDDEIKKNNKHPVDKKAKKIFFKRIIRETYEFLIEKQPIAIIKKATRASLRERTSRYKKDNRISSLNNYRMGIETHEKNNESKVREILNTYNA